MIVKNIITAAYYNNNTNNNNNFWNVPVEIVNTIRGPTIKLLGSVEHLNLLLLVITTVMIWRILSTSSGILCHNYRL
jgi:hypothetical protein